MCTVMEAAAGKHQPTSFNIIFASWLLTANISSWIFQHTSLFFLVFYCFAVASDFLLLDNCRARAFLRSKCSTHFLIMMMTMVTQLRNAAGHPMVTPIWQQFMLLNRNSTCEIRLDSWIYDLIINVPSFIEITNVAYWKQSAVHKLLHTH